MGVYHILSLLSVLFFCLASRLWIRAVVQRPVVFRGEGRFSLRARRIERGYKILAFGVLTLVLFASMVTSFVAAFTELPG